MAFTVVILDILQEKHWHLTVICTFYKGWLLIFLIIYDLVLSFSTSSSILEMKSKKKKGVKNEILKKTVDKIPEDILNLRPDNSLSLRDIMGRRFATEYMNN